MAHGTAESVAPINSKSLKYLESKWQAKVKNRCASGLTVAAIRKKRDLDWKLNNVYVRPNLSVRASLVLHIKDWSIWNWLINRAMLMHVHVNEVCTHTCLVCVTEVSCFNYYKLKITYNVSKVFHIVWCFIFKAIFFNMPPKSLTHPIFDMLRPWIHTINSKNVGRKYNPKLDIELLSKYMSIKVFLLTVEIIIVYTSNGII